MPARQRHSDCTAVKVAACSVEIVDYYVRHSFLRETRKEREKCFKGKFTHVQLTSARLPPRKIIMTLFYFYFYFYFRKGPKLHFFPSPDLGILLELPEHGEIFASLPSFLLPFLCSGRGSHLSILYACDIKVSAASKIDTDTLQYARGAEITPCMSPLSAFVGLGSHFLDASPISPLLLKKEKKRIPD